MTYHGTVQGGVVVFDGERPADGSIVTVRESEPADASGAPSAGTLGQRLSAVSGIVPQGVFPADASANVDHYLYGHPKR